jgi:hypothetical protein
MFCIPKFSALELASARAEAQAARGAFWEVHDLLYETRRWKMRIWPAMLLLCIWMRRG